MPFSTKKRNVTSTFVPSSVFFIPKKEPAAGHRRGKKEEDFMQIMFQEDKFVWVGTVGELRQFLQSLSGNKQALQEFIAQNLSLQMQANVH